MLDEDLLVDPIALLPWIRPTWKQAVGEALLMDAEGTTCPPTGSGNSRKHPGVPSLSGQAP